MYNTDQHESLLQAQREANELFERLETAPPTEDEMALQKRYPQTSRTQILRLVVRLRLSA
jgi:hypothetical protein